MGTEYADGCLVEVAGKRSRWALTVTLAGRLRGHLLHIIGRAFRGPRPRFLSVGFDTTRLVSVRVEEVEATIATWQDTCKCLVDTRLGTGERAAMSSNMAPMIIPLKNVLTFDPTTWLIPHYLTIYFVDLQSMDRVTNSKIIAPCTFVFFPDTFISGGGASGRVPST